LPGAQIDESTKDESTKGDTGQKPPEAPGLLSDGAVPVEPAALKEAVPHHALAKQKKEDC
jgi:hypothetical protein